MGRQFANDGATLMRLAFLLACVACSPTFDWRENTAEGTGVVTSFPCRPDRHARVVGVAGASVQMEMLVCSAGGATYAVGFYDAAGAVAVDAGLASLQAAMLANVQAGMPRSKPLRVIGMDPRAAATRISADGRRPDGGALRLEAAFFAKGRRVYQAAVVGPPLPDDAIDPFFDGLKLSE